MTGQSPPMKPRSREEHVFATDTEVQWMQDPTDAKTQWMREWQAELAEATVQGAHREVFRLIQEMARPVIGFRGRCCNLPWGERRFRLRIWDRIVQHQGGFLGCRVGEASNPGPAITRQGRRLERSTQIDVSSDEEFLVRPNQGRNVVARRCVDGEETPPCLTVPARSQELLEANLPRVPQSLLDELEQDLSEVQPTTVDTVFGSVPQASPVQVRNRFDALNEDAVLRAVDVWCWYP